MGESKTMCILLCRQIFIFTLLYVIRLNYVLLNDYWLINCLLPNCLLPNCLLPNEPCCNHLHISVNTHKKISFTLSKNHLLLWTPESVMIGMIGMIILNPTNSPHWRHSICVSVLPALLNTDLNIPKRLLILLQVSHFKELIFV